MGIGATEIGLQYAPGKDMCFCLLPDYVLILREPTVRMVLAGDLILVLPEAIY
tara:strand:- start:2637 stop:2795 length:159 start_codon:yes stop_codon:yes gene_type:complete